MRNLSVSVIEENDHITFLHRIENQPADKSYGIQVGRLAGLPKEVIARAKEVLGNLEESELSAEGKPKLAKRKSRTTSPESRTPNPESRDSDAPQMFLFGDKKK